MRAILNAKIEHRLTVLFITCLLFCAAQFAYADDAVVSNTISVTSSSGGNTASGGQTVEGESHASVHIESDVNGETHVIDKESTGPPIEIHETLTSGEGTTSISVETAADEVRPRQDEVEPRWNTGETGSTTASTTATASSTEEAHAEFRVLQALSRFIAYVFSFLHF